MIKYKVLGDGKYNFILQNKSGSTTLRNYIGDLKEFEIEFYNNDLPIIVPIRTPWDRLVSGQVQDFMDLIVEDYDIYATGSDDSKIHILSIDKEESQHFKLFLEKLHKGYYVDEVRVNEITDVGFSICSRLFNESSNHHWWFEGHTWPNDLLVRQYNESKRTGKIRFVLLKDLTEVIKVLFGRGIPPSDIHDNMNTKKYIRHQLLNVNSAYGNKIKGGFLFGDSIHDMGLTQSEKIIFCELFGLEEYFYEKILEDGVRWWESMYEKHPQRLEYQQYWVIPKLKKVFDRVCKNSIFILDSGNTVEYDVDYYRSLIDGGHINDNNLWVFWMKHEAYLPFESDIRNLHKVCKELDLDESKIVFVNSDLNLHNNYTEWFGGTNFEKPINCIGFSWYFLHDRENLIDGFGHNPYEFVRYTDREKLPSKKFICLNGNSTKPRRYVINKLEEYKNDGYISDLSKGITLDTLLTEEELLKNKADGNASFSEPSDNPLDFFYNDSYFSIVQESGGGWKANSSDKISAFFSEKITKPLYYGHPFILIGFKNSLKVLRDMGFKTYDDIFDESYDELETWEERTKHVWYQVERLLKLSKEELKKMFEKVEDKILFNQERFFSYDGHVDNFITELEELYMERDK